MIMSSCPSVTLYRYYCGAQDQCRGLKVVSSCPGGDFLFTSSDTFAIGCINQYHLGLSKKADFRLKLEISKSYIVHSSTIGYHSNSWARYFTYVSSMNRYQQPSLNLGGDWSSWVHFLLSCICVSYLWCPARSETYCGDDKVSYRWGPIERQRVL